MTNTRSEGTDVIAILPLGAHEYHGPHLPLETDAIIASGIARRLREALADDRRLVFLETEPVGYSVEHLDRPGTLSFAYHEAVERWLGIAADLSNQGIRRLILLNAHGGNSPLLTIVATEARIRFGILCVATSWTRFGLPEGVIAADEKAFGIHGGDIETSVMLALSPESVDMTATHDFPSRQEAFARDFRHLRAYGPHAFGWRMRDLNPEGAAGNAAIASREKGERLIAHSILGLSELIDDVARFDLALFDTE